MITAADLFVRQALWRPAAGTTAPEPVAALLGPPGAGKTTALKAIADACGAAVVHARLDFAEPQLKNAVAAVSYAAFLFMRHWENLPNDPTFHRVGLSLLALTEKLPPDRKDAKARLRKSIDDYLHKDVDDQVANLASAAADIATVVAKIVTNLPVDRAGRELVTGGVVALLRLSRRHGRSVRRALKWFDGLLDGANSLDSLIDLSRGGQDPLDHLMSAFLADLTDNAAQWSIPVRKCACEPGRRRDQPHEHPWVLLADHVEAADGAGWDFLSALVKARQARRPTRDPLLVVAAVDRWSPAAWGSWWREPWYTGAERPSRRPIPLLSRVDFDEWTRHLDATADDEANPTRAWFPVWLDPPTPTRISELAGHKPDGWDRPAFDEHVRQLSGDLPAAAKHIAKGVAVQPSDAVPDARSVLFRTVEPNTLWEQALRSCLPDTLQAKPLWYIIPQAVAVAVRLRQPGPAADDLDHAVFPDANLILRTLRERLWVSTFAAGPSRLWPVVADDAEHPAVLHPWLLACLLAGLHAESPNAGRREGAFAWADLFSRMSDAYAATAEDTARRLYYDLACDRFGPVVAALVRRFPLDDHRDWVRLLDQVTAAPCRWPAVESTDKIFDRLVPENQQGRTTVETAVATLLARLWLGHDPHTVPNALCDTQIRTSFEHLANNFSSRLDTSALTDAAKRFGRQ